MKAFSIIHKLAIKYPFLSIQEFRAMRNYTFASFVDYTIGISIKGDIYLYHDGEVQIDALINIGNKTISDYCSCQWYDVDRIICILDSAIKDIHRHANILLEE